MRSDKTITHSPSSEPEFRPLSLSKSTFNINLSARIPPKLGWLQIDSPWAGGSVLHQPVCSCSADARFKGEEMAMGGVMVGDQTVMGSTGAEHEAACLFLFWCMAILH